MLSFLSDLAINCAGWSGDNRDLWSFYAVMFQSRYNNSSSSDGEWARHGTSDADVVSLTCFFFVFFFFLLFIVFCCPVLTKGIVRLCVCVINCARDTNCQVVVALENLWAELSGEWMSALWRRRAHTSQCLYTDAGGGVGSLVHFWRHHCSCEERHIRVSELL